MTAKIEERETTKQKAETKKQKRARSGFWTWVVALVAFLLALVYLPRNLRLSTRPEVASPLTSIRRLGEGYWLKQSVMSPYAGSAPFDLYRKEALIPSTGSMYHGSPLLLLVLGPLVSKGETWKMFSGAVLHIGTAFALIAWLIIFFTRYMVKSTLLLPATRHMASVREQEQAYDQLEDKMRRECEKREKQLIGQLSRPDPQYTVLFWREIHAVPSSIQEASTMTSTASPDNYFSDMYHSPPRPLPYDVEPRRLCMQRDGLDPRHEKGSSHANEESEPLRSDTDGESDNICSEGKWTNYAHEKGFKEQPYKTSLKLSSAKANADIGHIYTTSEEEDVCPTCLEEYTPENPRIMTKCSHHFHLGCIYEWKERSDICPVCGKVMVFDET